jgi:hypothetical protein
MPLIFHYTNLIKVFGEDENKLIFKDEGNE